MEELLNDFLAEANDHLDQVERQIVRFENDPSDTHCIASIFRLVHTLKGTSGFLDLSRLERLTHAAETLLSKTRDAGKASPEEVDLILQTVDAVQEILANLADTGKEPEGEDTSLIAQLESAARCAVPFPAPGIEDSVEPGEPPATITASAAPDRDIQPPLRNEHGNLPPVAASALAPETQAGKIGHKASGTTANRESASIRVMIGTLERIMRLVSELVLTRNQLIELSSKGSETAISGPLQRLSAITTDLQDSIMQARMQPIDRLFASIPRIVRELSQELKKQVNLIIEGSDTELDRQLIELIRDPLMHLVRNCIDHGIESPAERIASNKSPTGTVRISAAQDAGFISINISDDGLGIDVARIRDKAAALGLADETQLGIMSDDELCRFIFAPGFSTAKQVTNISGRGFGMDVVRENIESIGGTVSLTTTKGQGTTITLKVPLTLAIIPALIFSVGGQRFAIPQDAVVEAVACHDGEKSRLSSVQGLTTFRLRNDVMPVADLVAICEMKNREVNDGQEVCDTLKDKLVIVTRIGSINFAISVDELADVQEIVIKPLSSPLSHLKMFSGNTILGDGSVVLILDPVGLAASIGLDSSKQYTVDAAGQNDPYRKDATNFILFRGQGQVQKALPFSLLSRIEEVDATDLVESDGQIFLRHNDMIMPVVFLAAADPARTKWPVLVVGVGGEPMGLVVTEIIDTIEHSLEIDIAGRTPAVIGTTTMRGSVTEILDLTHFMQSARPDEFDRKHAHRFRLLLVDDKLFFRDMLAPIIAASGYEINTADSAASAMTAIRRGAQFDAILTDVDMPGANGYELTAMIREIPAYAHTPIIALDAFAGEDVVLAAKSAGMLGVIGKFDRKLLVSMLKDNLTATAFQQSAIESRMESRMGKDATA
jgi:two-component system, chemotaxis family, sensor kinase CheA